jgi:hypothetical protein
MTSTQLDGGRPKRSNLTKCGHSRWRNSKTRVIFMATTWTSRKTQNMFSRLKSKTSPSSTATSLAMTITDYGVPGILFWRGVQKIQFRTEGRENGDLGAVAPSSGFPLNLQMSETRMLIRLLRMYFPRNWKFDSALSKLRNFGEGVNPPNPSARHWSLATTITGYDRHWLWPSIHSLNAQLHVTCTNTERSVTATLTTLTHNTSTQRYLAAHNCIMSLKPSMRTVRNFLFARHAISAQAEVPAQHYLRILAIFGRHKDYTEKPTVY